MAIMAVRDGLAFETTIESDCAPLAGLVGQLFEAGIEIHCLRDLTRGGLASALVEIAEASKTSIRINETAIATQEDVQGACEILGLDPLYVANEGRFIGFAPPKDADRALEILRAPPLGEGAGLIGHVQEGDAGLVTMKSAIGTTRVVDMMSGEQLPRIC
jgi:hydrogenase expression/formation protein HypE